MKHKHTKIVNTTMFKHENTNNFKHKHGTQKHKKL